MVLSEWQHGTSGLSKTSRDKPREGRPSFHSVYYACCSLPVSFLRVSPLLPKLNKSTFDSVNKVITAAPDYWLFFPPPVNRWVSQQHLLQPGRGRGTGGRRVCGVHVLLRRSHGWAADLYGCSTSSLCAFDVLLLKTWAVTGLVAPGRAVGSCELSLFKSPREAVPVNAQGRCDLNPSSE